MIERLGWVPDRLSELAQGIGKRLGARVMSAFDAFAANAREASKAYNAARAARGEVPQPSRNRRPSI